MNEAMERLRSRRQGGGQSAELLNAIMQPLSPAQGDIVQIPGGKLHPFRAHTFRLRPDSDPYMTSLLDSIRETGILEPLLARPHPGVPGEYEIIAGHTRHHLGQQAGLMVFPCIVRAMDDTEAVIQMGESNVQRPDWLPSEKARTYKAHLEAIREKRRTSPELGSGLCGVGEIPEPGSGIYETKKNPGTEFRIQWGDGESRELAAKRWGITGKALDMYIKLNDLTSALLRLVDEGRIPVKAGFQLAFLPADNQHALFRLLGPRKIKVNEAAAKALRQAQPEDFPRILGLGAPAKRPTWSVALPRDLLPDRAKEHLADPELQERLAAAVRQYLTEKENG